MPRKSTLPAAVVPMLRIDSGDGRGRIAMSTKQPTTGGSASGSALELSFEGELVVHEACREVREHEGYFVISDRDNERFYWSDYVHHKTAPEGTSIAALENLHEKERPVRSRFIFTWNDGLGLSLTTDRVKLLRGRDTSSSFGLPGGVRRRRRRCSARLRGQGDPD
jgi:hypothetical protein